MLLSYPLPLLRALVFTFLLLPGWTDATVWIHEFMASNGSTIADEEGDFEDWIELYNHGDSAVDLQNWGLSDNSSQPFKWTFPESQVLEPGEFLLVWASGKDRAEPLDARPHANFRISAAGAPLSLNQPDGSLADAIPAVSVPRDVSFGRTEADPEVWAYFYQPTPEAPNTTTAFNQLLEPVTFSHSAGFYQNSFTLTVDHPDPQVTIVYTLDGSEPDIKNLDGTSYSYLNSYTEGPFLEQSFTSNIYSAPINVEDRSSMPNKISQISSTVDSNPSYLPSSPIKKGTVVRARAYVQGAPGPVTTATYFISETGAFDYSMPIVSLSVNEDGLFDFVDGIYVGGIDHVTSSGARICNWGNYNRRGREAERPAHIEFFHQGDRFLEQTGGIRIQGNCSRRNPFKSMRLYARADDPEDESLFVFPFFSDMAPGALYPDKISHRRLILRAPNFNDTVFSRLFYGVYEGLMGRLQPVKQFINGEYWGLLFLRDRFDPYYLHYHYGLDPDNITIIGISYRSEFEPIPHNFSDRVYSLSSGIPSDMEDFEAMRAYIIDNNMADPLMYAGAQELICIDSFIDHLILKIFAGDDHYAPEVVHWRAREVEDDGLGDGRWRFLVKDFDSTLRTDNYVLELATGTHPRPFGHETFSSLLANEDFRRKFINRFADLLNTFFLPARFQEIINQTYNEVAPYWAEASGRWNNADLSNPNRPFTASNRNSLINWSIQHPNRQRNHLRSYFNSPAAHSLTINVNEPEAGYIRVNTVVINDDTPGVSSQPYPWTGIYFNGFPIELEAHPESGKRFVEWQISTGGGATTIKDEPVISIEPAQGITVEAIFEEIPLSDLPLTLHRWDFEDPFYFPAPSFTLGEGHLTIHLPGESEALRNVPAQDFATAHLRINNPLNANLTLKIPTTGYDSISIDFLTRRSGQGTGEQVLSYSLDGVSWTEFETYAVFNAPPQPHSFDFSSIPGAANNPHFALRIEFLQGEGGTAGNNRFDNFVISGVSLQGRKRPPIVNEETPTFLEVVAGREKTLDADEWFTDVEGSPLILSALPDDPSILFASFQENQLVLAGLAPGESRLEVLASDGINSVMTHSIRVLVHAEPYYLAFGTFQFNEWSPNKPAGQYPPHMLLVQSGMDDPGLEDSLPYAYRIPSWDAADAEDVDFPYNASSRTRINGLGTDGISFINTGRGRDLGAAVLTLDTTGAEDIRVSWTGGTVEPNERVTSLQLQYRIGLEGTWSNVSAGSEPVAYNRNEAEGHTEKLGPVSLPPAAENAPLIQLRWVYHLGEEASGPRAMLRLSDIKVESTSRWTNLSEFLPSGDGEWAEHSHWTGGVYPDGPGSGAFIPAPMDGDRNIDILGPLTIGTLWVETGTSTHRTGIRNIAAEYPLLFNGGNDAAVLYLDGEARGYLEIQNDAGVELATDLWLLVPENLANPNFAALRLNGTWAGPGGLIKDGQGILHLSGKSDPANGIDRITVLRGGVELNGDYPVPVELAPGTRLTGSGSTGVINSAGRVVLEKGLITAQRLSGPSVTAFFNQPGVNGNGLLRLTDSNAIDSFTGRFDWIVPSADLNPGDRLQGGLFVPEGFDLAAVLANADIRLLVPDGEDNFREAKAEDMLSWRFASETIFFAEGPITGTVVEILQGGKPQSFAQWKALEIEDSQQRANQEYSSPLADPFDSGIQNLLRYALGVGWAEPPHDFLPYAKLSTDGFAIHFPFNPELQDITYQIHVSPDLFDWGAVLFDSSHDTFPETVEGWISLPLETNAKNFYQLIVLPRPDEQ